MFLQVGTSSTGKQFSGTLSVMGEFVTGDVGVLRIAQRHAGAPGNAPPSLCSW